MIKNRVCFTIRGEFGAQMSFESKNTIPYEDLCKCVNKDTLVEMMCLDKGADGLLHKDISTKE